MFLDVEMKRLRIAFVGSGGGARGLAHLGVLKACEEVGVVPTIFVGSSVGAIVAASYAEHVLGRVPMGG